MFGNPFASMAAAVLNAARGVDPEIPEAPPPFKLVDLRKQASNEDVYGRRSWRKVTGVCLHQTACTLGERYERWLKVGCHIGITRSGQVLWLHDFDRLVVHGNGFNAQTVGIEFDGLYAGIHGDDRTVWDDPSTARHEQGMTPTPEAMQSGREAIRWIVSRVAKHKGAVNAIVAHRQAKDWRRNDPGSAIWQAVALPMQRELGLSDGGVGFKIGEGRAIPVEWDERCKGVRY
jgi:hypothetical protein